MKLLSLRATPLGLNTGIILIGCLLLIAFFGENLAPHDPNKMDLVRRLEGMSWTYPLGTDHLGRDVLSRLMSGTLLSLGSAVMTAVTILFIALPIGLISAMLGGWVNHLLMRITDIFLAFPMIIFSLVIIGFLGASLNSAIIGVALAWWPSLARLVHTLTTDALSKDFVLASRQCGIGPVKLVIRHILPQILPPLFVVMSLEMASILLVLSSLSFLGIGAQPPEAEWGAMLNEARPFFTERPGLLLAPGLLISLAVMGFNLLGEGIRHKLDNRSPFRW
ncbi:ABC transporter permease [Kiloniella sp. EL199]|uniref:ABC transporter permease n=1 Tax=Kiloniella sp. EL199 TaxID=2107581 RepID=UPI000EA33B1A|nr:ABC transporter permease subunit [Kiloniella sp. EL199]